MKQDIQAVWAAATTARMQHRVGEVVTRLMVVCTLLMGCGGSDAIVSTETMAEAISDLDFAWCTHQRECRGAGFEYCGRYSLMEMCDSYVNCDVILTAEQSEAFDTCIADVDALTCTNTHNPASCLVALGLGES